MTVRRHFLVSFSSLFWAVCLSFQKGGKLKERLITVTDYSKADSEQRDAPHCDLPARTLSTSMFLSNEFSSHPPNKLSICCIRTPSFTAAPSQNPFEPIFFPSSSEFLRDVRQLLFDHVFDQDCLELTFIGLTSGQRRRLHKIAKKLDLIHFSRDNILSQRVMFVSRRTCLIDSNGVDQDAIFIRRGYFFTVIFVFNEYFVFFKDDIYFFSFFRYSVFGLLFFNLSFQSIRMLGRQCFGEVCNATFSKNSRAMEGKSSGPRWIQTSSYNTHCQMWITSSHGIKRIFRTRKTPWSC